MAVYGGLYVVIDTISNRVGGGRDDQITYLRGFKRRRDAKAKAEELWHKYNTREIAKTEAYWQRAMRNEQRRKEKAKRVKQHKKSVAGKLERAEAALKRALTREKRAVTYRKKWQRKVRYYTTTINKQKAER